MCLRRKLDLISSDFSDKEAFDFREAPKHFVSVTDRSLRRLKKYCLQSIRKKYKNEYKASALEAMLESISGEFDAAYVRLEGDYSTRYGNLESAFANGVAELYERIAQAENKIDDQNRLFAEYASRTEILTGRRPIDQAVTIDQLRELKQKLSELEKEAA